MMMGTVAMPDSIEQFPSLPEELIKLIFEHACVAHPSARLASDSSRAKALDVKTTLRLMQVSRAAHSLIVPILYRSVTISRPSQLMALASTLLARPALGLLIRNLWVGSLDSAPMNYLPCIISDVELAVAAKSHLAQYSKVHGDTSGRKLFHTTTADLVYVEAGVEYAAMHVPPKRDRLVEPTHGSTNVADNRSWDTASMHSSTSTADADTLQAGYGVDRTSLGYDAAGEWIGMDEWMLRCLELQRAIEFHWEWVGVTCGGPVQDEGEADRAAKENDPMDWADATEGVRALPSHMREFSGDTMASSSTTEYLRSGASSIGFQHLRNFFSLRQDGHSPQSATKVLVQSYLRSVTAIGEKTPEVADVCNLFLMADAREEDHFLHPALFARSGAIHLIVPAEPPEGLNAPPNAIPATTAAASYLHDLGQTSSDDSSDDERINGRARSVNGEGRHHSTPSQPLDFVDLFGHISHSTRTLYSGQRADDSMFLSQTLRPESAGFEIINVPKRTARPRVTLGGLLANLRAVMAMCPRVKVLGLNGFLERAVGGTRECAGMTELRHLSLGPPPPFWSSALNLHQPTFSSLRSLHISGCMLFRSEAMALGGFTDALPRLREVDWTLWLGHALEHPINVVEALSYLIGKEVPSAVGSRPARANGPRRAKPLRKVRATLNGEDIAFWRRHAVPESLDDERLILRECSSRDTDVNLRAVRRWWEAKAGLT